MITVIEAILGSKVGRVIAEVLLGLLLIFGVYHYVKHKGAAEELGKLQQSSATLIAKANTQIASDGAKYAAAQKSNQEKADEDRKTVGDLQSQLADSVRGFDAYRRAHADVARPAGSSGPASAGECGSEDCGAVVERLAVRGNELAGSVGLLGADLQSCQRDRDALTGEPK